MKLLFMITFVLVNIAFGQVEEKLKKIWYLAEIKVDGKKQEISINSLIQFKENNVLITGDLEANSKKVGSYNYDPDNKTLTINTNDKLVEFELFSISNKKLKLLRTEMNTILQLTFKKL